MARLHKKMDVEKLIHTIKIIHSNHSDKEKQTRAISKFYFKIYYRGTVVQLKQKGECIHLKTLKEKKTNIKRVT